MDTWDEGIQYEDYMGRWSKPVAHRFLEWLDVGPGLDWIDVGCGTGALTEAIAELAVPGTLWGVDPSPGFIRTATRRLGSRAHLPVGDGRSLAFEDDMFDVAVIGLALNYVPDPLTALAEFRRVTRPGGLIAGYVWDYAEGMEMIREFWTVATSLDPTIAHLDQTNRFPLCAPQPLNELFAESGLSEIEVTALVVPTVFTSFDDYWTPMLGGQGGAPSYVMSLDGEARSRLKAGLAARLAPEGGQVSLRARAWGVKGGN